MGFNPAGERGGGGLVPPGHDLVPQRRVRQPRTPPEDVRIVGRAGDRAVARFLWQGSARSRSKVTPTTETLRCLTPPLKFNAFEFFRPLPEVDAHDLLLAKLKEDRRHGIGITG